MLCLMRVPPNGFDTGLEILIVARTSSECQNKFGVIKDVTLVCGAYAKEKATFCVHYPVLGKALDPLIIVSARRAAGSFP